MPRLKAKASRRDITSASATPRPDNDLRRKARQRDRRRERRIGITLTLLCAIVFICGFTWAASVQRDTLNDDGMTVVEGDEERRRAAVLFVPLKGNVCRRRVIDNSTWLIKDAGFVTCDEAVTWNSHYPDTKFHFAQRVDQLRSGFRTYPGAK